MPKVYFGKRGAPYVMKHGKRVYLSQFGGPGMGLFVNVDIARDSREPGLLRANTAKMRSYQEKLPPDKELVSADIIRTMSQLAYRKQETEQANARHEEAREEIKASCAIM